MTHTWDGGHFDVINPDLGLLMPDCPAELSIQVCPRSLFISKQNNLVIMADLLDIDEVRMYDFAKAEKAVLDHKV